MKHIIPAIAVLFCLATAANADPCKLILETRVDMHSDGHGHAAIPVQLNGENFDFIVDTGGAATSLSSATADKLGLPRHPQNHSAQVAFGGAVVTQYVTAEHLLIGTLNAYKFNFAVLPNGVLKGIDGLIAPDILAANDVDFDFGNGKFSIFSQSHCYGGVVYWTKTGFAQVPFRFDEAHHIALDVSVDGKPTYAALDTGAPQSIMSLEYAERTFGIEPNSPDLKLVPLDRTGGRHFYHYPFKALSFNGVVISDPDIFLIPDAESDTLGGGDRPKMLVGLSVLGRLHLYIAYGEHNLYVTGADAH